MWTNENINCKWAPYLLYGPNVSEEHALEFIRRTDHALVSPRYKSNARNFEEKLTALIGIDGGDADWKNTWARQEAYQTAFGHIDMTHLGSSWVASSWIFGPSGPVHPNGVVYKVANFGKYPSVEKIEADLDRLKTFKWLSFRLYVWDNYEEKAEGDPQFGWTFDNGEWARTEEAPNEPRRDHDLGVAVRAIAFGNAEARECTWSVEQIDQMWGEQIREAARAAANATVPIDA